MDVATPSRLKHFPYIPQRDVIAIAQHRHRAYPLNIGQAPPRAVLRHLGSGYLGPRYIAHVPQCVKPWKTGSRSPAWLPSERIKPGILKPQYQGVGPEDQAGHAIGLAICSSSFSRYERQAITGSGLGSPLSTWTLVNVRWNGWCRLWRWVGEGECFLEKRVSERRNAWYV